MKILVFGGSGFIGKALVPFLRHKNHTVEVFSRHPSSHQHYWNPETHTLDPKLLEHSDVVINLSGENIFGIGTKNKLHRIEQSRISSTKLIVNTLKTLNSPPSVYIGASAVGYYGDRADTLLKETSPPGHNFFSSLCQQVESIANTLKENNIRVVNGRFGIVLSKKGGALTKMLPVFKFGLGGRLGSGEQYFSWIALDDFLNAIDFIISKQSLQGAINITSPYPIKNKELTKALAHRLQRFAFLNVPASLIKLIFGQSAPLYLASTKAYPKVLMDTGFIYQYPYIDSALQHLI